MLIVIQLLLSALFMVTERQCQDIDGYLRQCREGYNYPDPNNCKNYFRCINGKQVLMHCDPGTYWEPDRKICEYHPHVDCTTVTELLAARQCQEGKNYPDPNNCKNYFRCINGIKVLLRCLPGTYWEQERENCEWNPNVDCTTVTRRQAARQCQDGQNFPDPNNCEIFYRCINGKKVLQRCDTGTYWEQEREICDWASNVDCKTKSNECQHGQTFPDPNNCANFFRCIFGKKVPQSCTPGTNWNTQLKICASNVFCEIVDNECQHGETFIDPDDCAQFFRCIFGKKVGQSCTPGTNWNQELKICDSNVQC